MRSRFVPVILSNADLDLASLVPRAAGGTADARIFAKLCRSYRVRGCAAFFLSAKAEHLHRDLQRSGAAHAHFLSRAADADKVTSRAGPFFDAVACGDMSAATAIARHSPDAHRPDREHEDDFHYVRLLMERFVLGAAADAVDRRLSELQKVAEEGTPSARVPVARALVARKAEAFEKALLDLIEEHRDFYETGFRTGRLPEEVWAIEGCLFVEGLALVRLAQAGGLEVLSEYPLIPSLALAPPDLRYTADSWRTP